MLFDMILVCKTKKKSVHLHEDQPKETKKTKRQGFLFLEKKSLHVR